MRRGRWWIVTAALVGGLVGAGGVRLLEPGPVWAQHLARFQNVDVDFETTGTTSTLTFFDRDSGALYLYVATGNGPFRFAKEIQLEELGGPLAEPSQTETSAAGTTTRPIPSPTVPSIRLPSGMESETQEGTTLSLPTPNTSRLLNLNTATVADLQRLPGIGPTLARRIVEYRQQNGPFRSVRDLLRVRGIGEARLQQIQSLVTVR